MAWDIDPAHSSLEFAVRHMVVSTIKGTFSAFTVESDIDQEDMTKSRGAVTVDVASLDTREARRDAHLRSADFFDVERFPTMTFAMKSVERRTSDRYRVTGDLTIRGLTREVSLDAEIRGPVVDPFGATRLGLSAEGRLNRHDFGLDWDVVTEAGSLVGGDVKMVVEAEFVEAEVPEKAIEKQAELELGPGVS